MAEDENDEVPKLPPDARLESLDKRLDRLQQAEAAKRAKAAVDPNMRITQIVIGYLVGGPLGGALIGWGLDSLFGTKPWLDVGDAVPRLWRSASETSFGFQEPRAELRATRNRGSSVAAEGKIDPMHQFTVEPLVPLHIGKYDISLTNSAAWMLATLVVIFAFMAMGMKRQLVPGRWQMAVEGLTGFIDDMVQVNIGPEGKKFIPYVFSLFTFILVANMLGLLPLAIVPGVPSVHADQPLQHYRRFRCLSFSMVLIVGFWRHGLHFFSLFLPHGTPL